MVDLYQGLSIAGSALMSQQAGVNVTSNNISNVNTPGYTREEVILTPGYYSLSGVRVDSVRRAVDNFLQQRLFAQTATAEFSQERATRLQEIETIVTELGENSIGAAMTEFFGAFRELAASPGETAVRTQALNSAENVARIFNQSSDALSAQQAEMNQTVDYAIGQSNKLIDEIRDLNVSIATQEAAGGDAPDLRDKRDAAVLALSEMIGARSYVDGAGNFTVSIVGGIQVVQGGSARHLQGVPNATTGQTDVYTLEGTQILLNNRIDTGLMGAALDVRDNEIPAQLSRLDTMAQEFITAVNAIHTTGVGLDGGTGRNLFAPAGATDIAANMSLDAAVLGNPDALGAAQDPLALPGDGRAAQALADMEMQSVAGGGTKSFSQALADWVAEMGQVSGRAQRDDEQEGLRLQSLQNMNEEVGGINLEEQMIRLTQFQRAFQAASKLITTIDEMLETVITLKR